MGIEDAAEVGGSVVAKNDFYRINFFIFEAPFADAFGFGRIS
jgi:hypothetical protein